MIKLSKTESTRFNKIKNLLVKILGFGKKDVAECLEGQHFGIDSNPIKGGIAIVARTTGQEDVVIGYIPRDRLANIGETRFYSTDTEGALKAFVWLKNDGVVLMNGNSFGGLVKIIDPDDAMKGVLKRLNLIENKVNTIREEYSVHSHGYLNSGSPASTSTTDHPVTGDLDITSRDDIENTKVKHG